MSRHHSHINTATTILSIYDGLLPFAQVLKRFFSTKKKYGSKDRRQIGHLCYCYFRAVRVLNENLSIEEKIVQSCLLYSSDPNPLITTLKPEWEAFTELSIEDKLEKFGLNIGSLFPNVEGVEESIDKIQFGFSHFVRPNLFLRVRPHQKEHVIRKLDKAMIDYQQLDNHCLALPNTSKIKEHLRINKEVVIQDYASQRVGILLDLVKKLLPTSINKTKVWDCCAASGGKAILAVDKLGPIALTLSDIRKPILQKLKLRLQQADIREYVCKRVDLTDPKMIDEMDAFDLIIADVPCTSSGTWSRTPERLPYFATSEIEKYSKLQKEITSNIQSKLKSGAFLLYITCSVYKQENSEVVKKLVAQDGLDLIKSHIYKGYLDRSDTMFAALLTKS